MKNISFRYRIFFALSAVILSYLVCSVLFLRLYVKNVLHEENINDGKALATSLSLHVADYVLVKDYLAIDRIFENIMSSTEEVSYIFIEKDSDILVHTFREGFPKELINIGHKKDVADWMIVNANGESYYDFSVPVSGGQGGVLRLGKSERLLSDVMKNVINSQIYIALFIFGGATVLSLIISNRLVKPLSRLTVSAEKIADGKYSESIKMSGGDEVGRLSQAFTKMADAVKVRENELRDVNQDLETVNIKLHEYIGELNQTKDELIKAKQETAVIETARAMIHHLRQPLTYLIMAIELFTDEIKEGTINVNEVQKKLFAIEEAGLRIAEILDRFEKLKEYKTVQYSDETKIVDIGE